MASFHFICPVSTKKSVLKHFVVLDGALLILDMPQQGIRGTGIPLAPQKKKGPSSQACIVSEVIPIETVEVDTDNSGWIQVSSHQLRWTMKMQFVSRKAVTEAQQVLEAGRRRARQFKMKQVLKALGIDADDMKLASLPPPHE